jgi:DNA-binding Lrp family transcriptional regulator
MDEKDIRVLQMLMEDARRPVVEIARELGMPRSTVQDRIRRMVETGLIRGFTAVPNYALLGRPVTAFILVSFMPGTVSQRELAEEIAKLPGVHEVHLISGEWDILLKVRAESMEAVGRLVIDRLRAMRGVARTVTCACFSTIKDEP